MAHHPLFEQQLAMYFAALPCPPLPILASRDRVDDDEYDGCARAMHTAHCSYDLIANYLIMAMLANDEAANTRRRAQQERCEAQLVAALARATSPEEAYTHFQRFTADYICCFAPADVGARFAPLDSVDMGDSVHKVCCQWSAGQDILHAPEGARTTASVYSRKSYRGLLQAALDRFRLGMGEESAPAPLRQIAQLA